MTTQKKAVAGAENKSTSNPGAGNRSGVSLLRVCGLFVALVLGLHLVQWLLVTPRQMEQLQLATAKISALLMSASGINLILDRTYILLGNASWEVTPECTAISAMIVYASFILAYPASARAKGLGLLAGLPFLFAANILRLFVLAWATELNARFAEYVHDYVWQVAFLLLVSLMWLAWLALVVERERRAEVSR
jgi:exosortase/archaeosortase family protein